MFIVCTDSFEAPRAGFVRATTERFCTEEAGRAACEFMLAAPSELLEPGLSPEPGEFDTCAPFNDASEIRLAPPWMASPLANALRFATVTACAL